jgi:hypothetical protein
MMLPRVIGYGDREDARMTTEDLARILEVADTLSTEAHHRLMRQAGSAHECPADGCVLSAEEHHRLAYGLLSENRELKRELERLYNNREN